MGTTEEKEAGPAEIGKGRPLTAAEKAEAERYERSREKREIISGYRQKIDKY